MPTKSAKRGYAIAAIIYSSIMIYLLFFAYFRANTNTVVNLQLFNTITEFWQAPHPYWGEFFWYSFGIIFFNVALFIPCAIFIQKFSKKPVKWPLQLALSVLIPTIIETLQYIFQVGAADIDDVLLNGIGMMIGFILKSKS